LGGGPEVNVAGGVNDDVAVYVAVEIKVEVNEGDGVMVGVREGVNVRLGVFVTGWKNVGDTVFVNVAVGEGVDDGVFVTVPVTMGGVELSVEV
jgi:hypothetical protein